MDPSFPTPNEFSSFPVEFPAFPGASAPPLFFPSPFPPSEAGEFSELSEFFSLNDFPTPSSFLEPVETSSAPSKISRLFPLAQFACVACRASKTKCQVDQNQNNTRLGESEDFGNKTCQRCLKRGLSCQWRSAAEIEKAKKSIVAGRKRKAEEGKIKEAGKSTVSNNQRPFAIFLSSLASALRSPPANVPALSLPLMSPAFNASSILSSTHYLRSALSLGSLIELIGVTEFENFFLGESFSDEETSAARLLRLFDSIPFYHCYEKSPLKCREDRENNEMAELSFVFDEQAMKTLSAFLPILEGAPLQRISSSSEDSSGSPPPNVRNSSEEFHSACRALGHSVHAQWCTARSGESSCVCSSSIPTHILITCNSAFERLFGYSQAEIRSLFQLFSVGALSRLFQADFWAAQQLLLISEFRHFMTGGTGKSTETYCVLESKWKTEIPAIMKKEFLFGFQQIGAKFLFQPVKA